MFVLLFALVFGGAITGFPDPSAYREYLLPGIFVQTIVFAAATVAIGMCDDINKGIIDRFRSLPMSRSAVLTGRTFSEVVYNAGILVVLMLAGLAVGWSVHTDLVSFLAGVALLLAFAYAMAWLGVWLGVVVPTVEVAQQVSFTVLFPITFVSGVFVPIATMPDWLQPFAYWNPVTTLASSLRNLWGNPNPQVADNFPTQNPILVTILWIIVFVAVFGPLGVRRYRNMSR
jgi:ABC transporter DrrB family efflux protein